MIKNVIFDLGGILIEFQPKKAIQKLNLTNEKAEQLYQCIFQDGIWQDMDAGKYTGLKQTLPIYLQKYPALTKEIQSFFQPGWEDMMSLIQEGYDFFLKVKQQGYHCYVLSNYPKDVFAYTENRYKYVFDAMDGMVISGRVKKAKPDPDIFMYLLETYDLKKEECVFFDDTKANVDIANKIGIHSYLYTNSLQAMQDLQNTK